MQNKMNLTQSEIEMIQIKRELEAIKEREAQLKKAAANEKQILEQKARMKKDLEASKAQVAATKAFLEEFMGSWKLQIDTTNKEYTVKNYLGDSKWEVVWEDHQPLEVARIVNGKYLVIVAEHITSGDSWGRGRRNLGYKMYLSGPGVEYNYSRKAIGRVSTLIKKYDEVTESIRYQAEQVQRQVSTTDKTVAKMKELYPDAVVVAGKGGEYANPYKRSNWFTFDTVTITFANGITMTYRVYVDGTLGRTALTFPKLGSSYDLMDVMNSITFNK